MRIPPQGNYAGEWGFTTRGRRMYRATGEWRAPKRGEFYLSGADEHGRPVAYRALNDLGHHNKFWIAREVRIIPQPDKWEWVTP